MKIYEIVFDEIVVVHSSDALKAIEKVTLGRQTSCSPTLHKHNGVMEAITHCGGMLNWCESKFIDVTRPFIYKDMGNDTVRQADQYDQSAAEHLTRKVNKRPGCSCTETAACGIETVRTLGFCLSRLFFLRP